MFNLNPKSIILKHVNDTTQRIINTIEIINEKKKTAVEQQDIELWEDVADKGFMYLFTLSKIKELNHTDRQMAIGTGILDDMNNYCEIIDQFVRQDSHA